MHTISVIEFITLDGVVEDPDGTGGSPHGGWAFRFGPESVAGDKFRLGARLEEAGLLLGRGTWQLFSMIWPGRTDEFSSRMNAATKWVVSRTLTDVSAWGGSVLVAGDLVAEVQRLRQEREVVVVGSTSIARQLMEHDLVDEYRLLVFPTVVGAGGRLFEGARCSADLRLTSVERTGAAALLCFERVGGRAEPG
ncbi:dihydrofolate reductase family protein [Microlunatus flavus]|uniref:Dihydrofolate reductase n=1 Tax=Microlunatus flavus TaxID=1036181 RepID=A0A1H9L864_9ACTN|nr:dihydrofolate reductase family protein [Microlunatus flavus]SER07616.1 Dihydrofolate reductase [Microlunatus flavus]